MRIHYTLVVGATSGLGREISIELAKKNTNLILIGRSESKLRQICLEINLFSNLDVITIVANLSNPDSIQNLSSINNLQKINIDTIIYCAAVKYIGNLEQIDFDKLHEIMNVNYFSAVAILKSFLKFLISGSNVYLLTSGSANFGVGCDGAYSASKAALERFAEAARIELKPKNINVSLISPGPMNTNLSLMQKSFSGEERVLSHSGGSDPSHVATKIVATIGNKKRRISLTITTPIIRTLSLLAPSIIELLTTKKND